MKKCLWAIFVFGYSICIAQQLPNSSFENWSLKNEYIEPDGWISTNAYAYFGAPETCYPFEDARSGQWSAKLETRIDPLKGDTLKAVMILGADYEAPGIAYAHRPAGLGFYYKHNHRDIAAMVALLTKWNTTAHRRDTVASSFTFFVDSTNTFTLRDVPFTYISTEMPDTCIILFVSSLKEKADPGNYLIIDDLQMYGFTGVDKLHTKPLVNVFPNPFSDEFLIDTEQPVTEYELTGIDGRLIKTGAGQTVDATLLPTGIYVLQVHFANGQTIHKRIVKQ